MPDQPLCEVFGYPVDNFSVDCRHHRAEKLCPYHNKIAYCTKAKKKDPLGVCSIWDDGVPVIVCPIRFRQNWQVIKEAGAFLVPGAAEYEFVTEARLIDVDEDSVGNIDIVPLHVVNGIIRDYGALEIQSVYISGNIREPFQQYMKDPVNQCKMKWQGPHSPRPDWLSSIKRLEHQLIVKGLMFASWGRRMAIVIQKQFYDNFRSLHSLAEVQPDKADMMWILYQLEHNPIENRYNLSVERKIYYRMTDVLAQFTRVSVGEEANFVINLEKKLRDQKKRI